VNAVETYRSWHPPFGPCFAGLDTKLRAHILIFWLYLRRDKKVFDSFATATDENK
jgi:hypothetical protein